jgi:uncharacterized membrane protein
MSVDHSETAEAVLPAHDPAEEIAHAKHHAVENIFFFAGFLTLILINVLVYEYNDSLSTWVVLTFVASRALLIAFFFNWLLGSFSLLVRTICFTVFFFGGMVFLSIWDSTIPHYGDPIALPAQHH